jgi:hypothetical protein
MTLDLLTLSAMTNAAMMAKPVARMVNAMATVQSDLLLSQSNPSPIELADRAQRRLFIASVIFGVTAALIGAVLAWLLWRANNRYQEAVTADANARIEQAKRGAEEARRDAAAANERAKELLLRIEQESLKRAEAEERLERVRRKVFPRGLTNLNHIMEGPKATAEIVYQQDDPEGYTFAGNVYQILMLAGWNVSPPKPFVASGDIPAAIEAGAHDTPLTIRANFQYLQTLEPDSAYSTLQKFFLANDLPPSGRIDESLPFDSFRIVIGPLW